MSYKLIGACLTVLGCGGMGLRMAASYRREIIALEQLRIAVEYMQCSLRHRLTPLPQLCDEASEVTKGDISFFFSRLSAILKKHISPNVRSCVTVAIEEALLTDFIADYVSTLGDILGQFDISGQLQGLENLSEQLSIELENRRKDNGSRIRSYQTLGLCAGAAMAILFL